MALVAALATPVVAGAAEYPGWGDTGWVYASRRDCCNAAISIACDYSAQACLQTGGVPNPLRGGAQRGTCQVQWAKDGTGGTLFRCYGEAAIWCR
jgi:hypothetical protein